MRKLIDAWKNYMALRKARSEQINGWNLNQKRIDEILDSVINEYVKYPALEALVNALAVQFENRKLAEKVFAQMTDILSPGGYNLFVMKYVDIKNPRDLMFFFKVYRELSELVSQHLIKNLPNSQNTEFADKDIFYYRQRQVCRGLAAQLLSKVSDSDDLLPFFPKKAEHNPAYP